MKLPFVILIILATSFGQTTLADRTVLHSLWHEGNGEAIHTGLLSRTQLESQGLGLLDRGLRLVDLETALVNGRRGFAGLFTEGSGGNFFVVDLPLRDMRTRMEEMRSNGLRMTDVEAYRDNGQTRLAAVFGPGQGEEALVRPLPFDDFLERKELMRTLGLRLLDVEPVAINGRYRFVGLYSSEVTPTVLTGFRPRQRFTELRDRLLSDGWEMFDFERIVNAQGNDVYMGLWREGDDASRVSRFRSPAEQLFFTSQQRQIGRIPIDMELKILPGEGPTTRHPGGEEPELPANAPHVTVTSGTGTQRFVIEFQAPDDQPLPITIPASWLPSWLPRQDSRILVPDTHCGFNIRNADRILWQVPGNNALNDDTFRSGEVTETNDLLGGISFSGPIGACSGMDVPWVFGPPFTAQEEAIAPLPNMRLVIEGVGAELRFQRHDAPIEELFDAHELFSDDFETALTEVLDLFEVIAEQQGNIDAYCSMVGAYWTAVCSTTQGSACPLPRPGIPACQIF